jgi:hypothetical protein
MLLLVTAGKLTHAHTPTPAQAIRFQPGVLRYHAPFVRPGSIVFQKGGGRAETNLEWFGPGTWRFTISKIPKNFYASGVGATNWILQRTGSRCVLAAENIQVSCPPTGFWGALTLSAQPEEAIQSLVDAKFISESEGRFKETNSLETDQDPATKGLYLKVGFVGSTPAALLETRGPIYRGEVPGQEVPVLQIEQTFLSPVLARFMIDGEIYTLKSFSNLDMTEKKTRFTSILWDKLEFSKKGELNYTFLRGNEVPATKGPSNLPKTISDLNTFATSLSIEGQSFIKILLLTH